MTQPDAEQGIPPAATDPIEPYINLTSETLDFTNPGEWVIEQHFQNLILTVPPPKPKLQEIYGSKSHYRISIAELQRMHLRKLQCKLADHVVKMRFDNIEPKNWEEDLASYVKAVQDYDFMLSCTKRDKDPFYITAERRCDNEVLQAAMRNILLYPDELVEKSARKHWESIREPIGGARTITIERTWWADFLHRLAFAVFGGAFLIGPMWLMTLHNTLYTGLISTTVFVAMFGLILSWYSDHEKDVLSSTAAYAAVLVVFVGIAQGPN